MDAQMTTNQVQCPFCGARDRKVYRREVVTDHRLLNHCHCQGCGEHYLFAEDKAGHVSVRKR